MDRLSVTVYLKLRLKHLDRVHKFADSYGVFAEVGEVDSTVRGYDGIRCIKAARIMEILYGK